MFGLFEKRKEKVQQDRVDNAVKKKREELNEVFDDDEETTIDLNKMIEKLHKTGTGHG